MTTPDPLIEAATTAYLGYARPRDCIRRGQDHSIWCAHCSMYDDWESEYRKIARIAPLVQKGLQKQLDDYLQGGEWCRNQRHGQLCELHRAWKRSVRETNRVKNEMNPILQTSPEFNAAANQERKCYQELLRFNLDRRDTCSPCN